MQIKLTQNYKINTFLPKELIPKKPKFYVWYSGTLGQAEWLISYSKNLRGNSWPIKIEQDLSNVPNSLIPLSALEQADLIISDKDNTPLMSIEITEQQEFGTNAQQRIARFWSAVANKIPSAYILPLESYQIDKCQNPDKIKKILELSDEKKRKFIFFCETLLEVNGEKTYDKGLTSIEQLKNKIMIGDRHNIYGVGEKNFKKLRNFYKKFVDNNSKTVHLQNILPNERYHKIGENYYYAYIRKPEIPGSMLLEWFNLASKIIPTYIFRLNSDLKYLFRTNGLIHTTFDIKNPHLSYRNLPLGPGTAPPLHKYNGNSKDEMKLFFDFVDSCIEKKFENDFLRTKVSAAGEYWDEAIKDDWYNKIDSVEMIDNYESADIECKKDILLGLISDESEYSLVLDFLKDFENVHIYKIKCTVKRGLHDPYSGNLAVRDILFTRESYNDDLFDFKRKKPLIFLVDLKEDAAEIHDFICPLIDSEYLKFKRDNLSAQDKLIFLLKNKELYKLPKSMRCHLLFSDLIIVRRFLDEKVKYEIILGIPSLLRKGLITKKDKWIVGLKI